jgi:hypothetical protein
MSAITSDLISFFEESSDKRKDFLEVGMRKEISE